MDVHLQYTFCILSQMYLNMSSSSIWLWVALELNQTQSVKTAEKF